MDTKINNNTANPLIQVPTPQAERASGPAKARKAKEQGEAEQVQARNTPGSVDVNVSPRAREMAEAHKKAFEIAKATPDVREERVADLKKRIQSGNYKVEPDKVADGMMREAIMDQLAQSEDAQ